MRGARRGMGGGGEERGRSRIKTHNCDSLVQINQGSCLERKQPKLNNSVIIALGGGGGDKGMMNGGHLIMYIVDW